MSLVNVIHMDVNEHTQASFSSQISSEITFECCQALTDDLEWKVVYVGSPESNAHDPVLEEVQVGPIPVGLHKFSLQAPSPCLDQIPMEHRLGVTVLLVTASYRQQEFCRIGYYVLNELIQPLQQVIALPELENKEGAATDVAATTTTPSLPSASFHHHHHQHQQQSDIMATAMTHHANGAVTDHATNTSTTTPIDDDSVVIVVDDPTMLMRTILADKPRVTRYHIAWQQDHDDSDDVDVDKENYVTGEDVRELDSNKLLTNETNMEEEEDELLEDDHMSASSTSGDSNISMEEPISASLSAAATLNQSAGFIMPPMLASSPHHSRLVSPS